MLIKISGIIITYNEEKYIERCLSSMINIVDEIIVVDSYSTDRTKEICEKFNVTFIERKFKSFGSQKNFAVKQATYDHVLCLDADEALSDTLKTSIIKVKNDWQKDAYWFKRRNYYCGKWLKYSGKYPDKKLRLFHRKKARWINRLVHETVEADYPKNTACLQGDLLHLEYYTYFEHSKKIDQYTTLSARYYFEKRKKSSLWHITYRSCWAFFKAYFIKLGFLDGLQGLIVSYFSAYSTFLKYVKLYGLQKGQSYRND